MTIPRLFAAAGTHIQQGSLIASIAIGDYEIQEAQRLRQQVFVREMRANLRDSAKDIHQDEFDTHCRHIVVRDVKTDEVVGTTRLLLQDNVVASGMYFAETGFDLGQILKLPGRFMNVDRHCIRTDHRNGKVQRILWSMIAVQMQVLDVEHLLTCVSLPMSGEGAYARAVLAQLPERCFTPSDLRAKPRLPLSDESALITSPLMPPAQLSSLLRLGALLCGDAGWDPVFNCADVVALIHRMHLAPRQQRHSRRLRARSFSEMSVAV